jgi:probable HAF family extracellular repeat protein
MSAAHHARRTLLLAILLTLPPLANAQSGGYRLTDLGLLPNSGDCYATGLNKQGQVVGTCDSSIGIPGKFSTSEAFVYANGVMTGLGVLPGLDSSYATAISDNGAIIGASYSQPPKTSGRPTKPVQGFLYQNQTLGTLNGLPAGSYTLTGISADGQILGFNNSQTTSMQSFLYRDGIAAPLPISMLGIINPRGQILGTGLDVARNQFTLYDAGRTTVIDIPAGTATNLPSAFNDAGQMVGEAGIGYGPLLNGSAYGAWGQRSAYLYAQGKVSYLGFLPGYNRSWPNAINRQGQVVGFASYDAPPPPECSGSMMSLLDSLTKCRPTISKPTRAFLYADQRLLDLNSLLSPTQAAQYVVTYASAINDAGQIAATANFAGHYRAVLLTPIDGTSSTPPAQAQSQSPALVTFQGSIQAAADDGTLRVRFEPGPVAGKSGQVFLVAMVPTAQGGQTFFMDSQGGWQLYADCASAPAYSNVGPLAELADIPLLGQAGLARLGSSAVTVYIGYGLAEAGAAAGSACRDMLKFQNYLPLLTL